uniref:Uncharacterized protein n=1 Tax=Anguilla anguilla TaxID=7936 RepID=A0A0E9S411_ANGAN
MSCSTVNGEVDKFNFIILVPLTQPFFPLLKHVMLP